MRHRLSRSRAIRAIRVFLLRVRREAGQALRLSV
jgi:hypothetical protein